MASHRSLLLLFLPLLTVSIFSEPSHATVTINADRSLIDEICKLSESYDFCNSTLGNDPRTAAADLNGLCLISISLTIDDVRSTSDRIPELRNKANDQVDKERLDTCQENYKMALDKFLSGYKSSNARSYWDVINWVRDGANEVINCENVYRRNPPIRSCPISFENHNVVKLVEITLIVINFLVASENY